ncbi:MAG: lipoyl protein ligase domain-containing protein [Acidimicrobiales bacterium]
MGAVPGGGFLSSSWFSVEQFRSAGHRRAVVRRAEQTMLVLGSTQPRSLADEPRRVGMPVMRRRSGGGAVLVVPDDTVWVDAWVPQGDPLWDDDVVRAAGWAGEWWAAGLLQMVGGALEVHRGGSASRPWSDVVCFAGLGPGEVTAGGRKVVGLAQWRCRQGALFHGCLYLRWAPRPLLALLGIDDLAALADLRRAAVGLDELCGGSPPDGVAVEDALLAALPPGPAWDLTR